MIGEDREPFIPRVCLGFTGSFIHHQMVSHPPERCGGRGGEGGEGKTRGSQGETGERAGAGDGKGSYLMESATNTLNAVSNENVGGSKWY